MSSADEGSAPLTKKRKLQRACDYCRRKKIKCDGPDMPNNRCSRCRARRVECTYKEAFSKSSYPSSYVENLESRLERMERLVSKLCPDGNIPSDPEGSPSTVEPSAHSPTPHPGPLRPELLSSLSPPSLDQSPTGSGVLEPSGDDDDTDEDLTEGLRKLSVESHPYRFHGRSSGMLLLREARQIATGSQWGQEKGQYRHHGLKSPREVPAFDDFPPNDLLDTLVELYFRKSNDVLPFLHEPMFKRSIQEGLHLRNSGFGATVLLVCAIASRFTEDPRVLLDGSEDRHSAGWRWYQQVENVQRLELAPATLYELQLCMLMVQFLSGSTAPQATWTLIGNGIRRAVDVGAHRRNVYNAKPTIEDELWKRAFWSLVVSEWTHSYGLGRPAAIHDEDIDVALPTPIDDEYWSLPGSDDNSVPQQPEGKPSKVAVLVSLIRLSQILAFASRTLYPINKSKRTDSSWEQRIVAELDSALNNWVDSLPSHLRWDKNHEGPQHLLQSSSLLGHFYQVQIAVHRPFLSSERRDSPLSFPSVIICNNAARSTVQMLEVVYRRSGTLFHGNAGMLYMCGAVLMRSILGQRRAGRTVTVDRDIACMKTAIEMLESIKYETYIAWSGLEYLHELLAGVNSMPDLVPTPSAGQDRGAATKTAPAPASTRSSYESANVAPPKVPGHRPAAARSTLAPSSSLRQSTEEPSGSGSISTSPDSQLPAPASFWAEQLNMQLAGNTAQQPFGSSSSSSFMDSTMGAMPLTFQQPFAGTPTAAAGGPQNVESSSQAEFDAIPMPMFGLEPLGYSEAVSLFPSSSSGAQASGDGSGMQSLFPEGAGHLNEQGSSDIMSDFAVLSDTLSVWTNGPGSFGWDEWGAYFNSVNDRVPTGSGK